VPPENSRLQLPVDQPRAVSRRYDSARRLRTVSPCTRRRSRQRCDGFLPARPPVLARLATPQLLTTQDASDRLLPLYTLTTSTHASLVPDGLNRGIRWFMTPVFASAGPTTFSAPRGVFFPMTANRCDRASDTPVALPRRPLVLAHTLATIGGAETAFPAFPMTRIRKPRSEVPSLDR
jgi:hypothetical protein